MAKKLYILLEGGHGVETPGKRSPDGLFREYLWARRVANLVVKKLTSYGYTAFNIVPEESDIPLTTRVKRVNEYCTKYGKGNVIFISVHCNAAGNGKDWANARGWSAYTSIGHTKSDELAEDLYWAAEQVFPEKGLKIRYDRSDGDSDWESNFYVLYHTQCPAVLVENFFQDNKEDYEYLMSSQSIEECSKVIVDGLVSYIQKL